MFDFSACAADHVNAHGDGQQAHGASNRQIQPVFPPFARAEGMQQACLQREDGENSLRKLQHPHRGINGAGMLAVFGKINILHLNLS